MTYRGRSLGWSQSDKLITTVRNLINIMYHYANMYTVYGSNGFQIIIHTGINTLTMDLQPHVDIIRHLIEVRRRPYWYVRQNMIERFGIHYSIRTIREFCFENNIHRTVHNWGEDRILQTVGSAVNEVGPYYGRRTMTGM